MSLLDRQLLLVTGKGGVGRTTVAATLALAAGLAGKRAVVVELYGNDRVARRFELDGRAYAPRAIGPRADTMSLTPYECLDDFAKQKLRSATLARFLFANRVFRAFVDAVPGLHDLFQLGKINNLVIDPDPRGPAYDLVVVDAPATGHGLTLLSAASSMREMVRVGLVSDEATLIEEVLHDPLRTGVVLTSLPAELPVNESLELIEALGELRDLLAAVVVNQVRPHPFPTRPPWPMVRAALEQSGEAGWASLGDDAVDLDRSQGLAFDRLDRRLPALTRRAVPVLRLPRIEPRELRRDDLPGLARTLLDQLELP